MDVGKADNSRAAYHDGDSENLYDQSSKAMLVDGRLLLPAMEQSTAIATRESDGARFVHFEMSGRSPIGNVIGVFMRLTPDGAELIGNQLLEDAQKVRDRVAEQAREAIERTRKGGA